MLDEIFVVGIPVKGGVYFMEAEIYLHYLKTNRN